jgi:transcriptional regulator with XRE-family HTH domain
MGSKRAEKARALDGEKVQALRLRLDLSLGALAAKADCAPRTVVNAEKGKPILFGVIRDLAEALEVENSDLMPGGPTVEEIIARKRTVKPGGVGESLLHERKPFLSQLGPDAADFVGREDEIAKMVNILCDGALRPRVCTIRGMGGVGKTTLALRVAHLVKTSYPDGQLMIELQGMSPEPTTVVAAMTQVVRAFGWDVESLPRDEAGMLPIYRNTMAGKRALLVLDNARDESQVRQLASLAAPAGVIVTSRSLLALDAAVDVGVEVLSPEQSFSLLHAITKDKGSESELRVVVDLCGQLPLALRVAGDFLRLHVNWTVTRYISALADEGRRLGHLKGRSENRDVEAVLALSARQLAVEDEPLAVRWEMLSAFRGPVNPEMAAVMWGLGPMSAPDADGGLDQLTELLDRSLLLHLGDDEYTYHDLMRPVALGVFGYVEGHRMQVGTGVRQEIAR